MKYYLRYGFILLIILQSCFAANSLPRITIKFDTKSGPSYHGVKILRETLVRKGYEIIFCDFSSSLESDILVTSDASALKTLEKNYPEINAAGIQTEGFRIYRPVNSRKILVAARDASGAMYGLLSLNDYMTTNSDVFDVSPIVENPHFEYRIVKFNLPWSPYRDSPATSIHLQTCRDLAFWENFLDMMAENRLNVLSLWNLHPFTYMIRPVNFPGATHLNDAELEDWKSFWKQLFRMAKDRGIQTFIVNWNIVVSPEFAKAYGAQVYNDTSQLVRKYTRECVAQTINEYEDLTGIGVTLADWMSNFEGNMSAKEREDWIEDTFVAGMKDAGRKVKFLHRSVLSGSPIEMRRVIDNAGLDEPALVEIKFNWSHGHSTPTLAITHDYHSGEVDNRFWEPLPENYRIQWMIRNEDFFILRWGHPGFIRKHIKVNSHDYVNGYFIGSEGYIPALDYSAIPGPGKAWQYGFEKQWLFYKLWGRLLYNPDTPDYVFEEAFDRKYGSGLGRYLLKAYTLASAMPLKLASYYRSTWDYTLYSEGFLAPRPSGPGTYFDGSSDFISIDELINHETLDPLMISIKDYANMLAHDNPVDGEKITPTDLADELEDNFRHSMGLVDSIRQRPMNTGSVIESELEDIITWNYLSAYFAGKLRGGLALEMFRNTGNMKYKNESVSLLQNALSDWLKVVEHTRGRYMPVPHVSISGTGDYKFFSWEYFIPQVERDIEAARNAEFIAR
ncbi:MAG TPA: hypothetical protein VI583_04620 [Cyclobacteriaceae bacterium]|nr:hypothetical protein [Cyclobacteriaceae bacterium]